MKRNLERYRSFFAANYPDTKPGLALAECIAFWNGGLNWNIGVGAEISRGTLPAILPNSTDGGVVTSFGTALTENANIATVLDANHLQKGDQITVVITASNGDKGILSTLFKSRYVINADAEGKDLNVAWNAEGTGNAFDAERTKITAARLKATAAGLVPFLVGADDLIIEGAAIIVSREVDTKWERSNAILVNMWDEHPVYSPVMALSQYVAGGSTIDTLSDRYLNNADRMGE